VGGFFIYQAGLFFPANSLLMAWNRQMAWRPTLLPWLARVMALGSEGQHPWRQAFAGLAPSQVLPSAQPDLARQRARATSLPSQTAPSTKPGFARDQARSTSPTKHSPTSSQALTPPWPSNPWLST